MSARILAVASHGRAGSEKCGGVNRAPGRVEARWARRARKRRGAHSVLPVRSRLGSRMRRAGPTARGEARRSDGRSPRDRRDVAVRSPPARIRCARIGRTGGGGSRRTRKNGVWLDDGFGARKRFWAPKRFRARRLSAELACARAAFVAPGPPGCSCWLARQAICSCLDDVLLLGPMCFE